MVLAVEDLDIDQVQQVFRDRGGLGVCVPGREQVGGFVGDGELDVAVPPGEPQVRVEALHGVRTEPELLPRLVSDHDPQVAGGGELAHAAPPAVEAGEGDADGLVAQGFEPGQRQRLDRGGPVHVDGGVVVEQPGERPGHELAQCVAQQAGLV